MKGKLRMTDIDITKTDALTDSVQGLEKTVTRLSKSIASAFSLSALASFTDRALEAGGQLEKELLVLKIAFGKLRSAIGQAAAPLGAVFIPLLSSGVYAITRFVRYVGEIIAALMGVQTVSKVTAKSVSAVYGSLADFDKIDRLKGNDGVIESVKEEAITLDLWQKMIVSKVQSLLQPLKEIDFSSAIAAFDALKAAIAPITQTAFAGLEWAWHNLLVPLANWTVTQALPAFLEVLTSAMTALNALIISAKPYFTWLWESFLQPIAQWAGERIISALGTLRGKLDGLTQWIINNQDLVREMTKIAAAFLAVWALGKLAEFGKEAGGLTGILLGLATGIGKVVSVIELVKSVFSGLKTAFKSGSNGVLGVVNSMLSGLTGGINGMVKVLNRLSFTIPDWVPAYGGKAFGLQLQTLTAPQIPYLAKGAVLPANKPFLAVVGDQRNGTNIEAPLSTIQQAVAVTMQGQNDAILAGFEASIGVQREILEAVLGIQLGDSVIGQAVTRYQQKLAVMQGV